MSRQGQATRGVCQGRAGATARCAVALACSLALVGTAPALGATSFDCLIEPAQVVEVRSPVVGLVEQVHARRGDTIRKGQVLVTIDAGV